MTVTDKSQQRSRFHVGMRNFKTALAAMLCALLYFPIKRNPTFACIGAIFGMSGSKENSFQGGGNRLFGTIIGGVIGMLLFSIYIVFYPEGGMHPLMLLLLFIGVISLIITSQLIHWTGAIQPGGVMLCIILFNTPVETYISYSVNRIFDTAFGVMIAIIINYLMPRERVLRLLAFFKIKGDD